MKIYADNSAYGTTQQKEVFTCQLGEDDEISNCYGYKRNIIKTVFYYITCILSGGIILLITYWKPRWKLKVTHDKSCLKNADVALIIDQFEIVYVSKIYEECSEILVGHLSIGENGLDNAKYRFFWYKHLKYFYNHQERTFKHLEGVRSDETFYDLTHKYNGIFNNERENWLLWYGSNKIDIKVKSYWLLFLEESAHPFYIFQVFSCALWFWDGYIYYACVIVVISLGSIIISIKQTRSHLWSLRNMIAKSGSQIVIQPDGQLVEIDSLNLVPGDVIVVPKNGGIMHCDAALISGTAIVNESMLTGESIPVMKTALPNQKSSGDDDNVYDSLKDKRHTLYAGTEVLQTRYYATGHVTAVVVRTGFSTMKGSLLRSILFPKPIGFQFFKDAMRFICVLGFFALIGLIYSVYILKKNGGATSDVIDKALDIITIAVPPGLPAAICVGTVYALQRLNKANIFCINPSRVNISGKIKLFCFDKTGTLTEDGLDFCGFIRAFQFDQFYDAKKLLEIKSNDEVIVGMATCHSLTIINEKITGDPLDMKMFEATSWQMEEVGPEEAERYGMIIPIIVRPKSNSENYIREKYLHEDGMTLEVAVMKQFPFSSELQRMSVVVRRFGMRNMEVYAKGSPEMIASLCDVKTIPQDFDECLSSYTKLGYRVLALAYKPLDSKLSWHKLHQVERDKIECDLRFIGFIVLKNVLKPETTPVIQKLYQAKIRVVMVTGDNILTAACVARECGMVKPSDKIIQMILDKNEEIVFNVLGELDDYRSLYSNYAYEYDDSNFLNRSFHYAVTGKVFSVIQNKYPNLYSKLLVCGTIFSRMLPDQKTSLIEGLQSLGYGVGMCGDGANDCGALKRAHAGISLSELEASVASPFTSKNPNIKCVIEVIREGRCALITSLNMFKFMALYSMIQYVTALMLYYIASNVGELQYLYIDLFMVTPIAITMSRTGPAKKLVAKRPRGRLMHPIVLTSILLQTLTQIGFQICIFLVVKTFSGYKPISHFIPNPRPPDADFTQIKCWENTMLVTYANFQYIIVALVFSVGRPYREEMYKNIIYLISIILLLGFNCILTILPNDFLAKYFELLSIRHNLYYYVIFFSLLLFNLFISYFIDHILLEISCVQRCLKSFRNKKVPKNGYKNVLQDLQDEP